MLAWKTGPDGLLLYKRFPFTHVGVQLIVPAPAVPPGGQFWWG